MSNKVACLLGILLLLGCATTYSPHAITGGYSDFQLDSNTFRVSFRGNGYTPRETVETYLLYRCAELTVAAGFDHFIIVTSETGNNALPYTTPGTYTGTTRGSATAYGNNAYGYSNTSGTYRPGQTFLINKYESTAMIKAFKGRKPDQLTAFDAREVLRHLEPAVEGSQEDSP